MRYYIAIIWLCLALTSQAQATPTQKLADKPKDTPIKVYTNIDTFCYMPSTAQSGKIYLQLTLCNDKRALKARYDVFGRLAYNINKTWFCITAPDSVAKGRASKDYALLTPCVINDKAQQWQLKDSMFYGTSQEYSLKDDGNYIYAAKIRDTSLHPHIIHNDMKAWVDTIAQPGNLSVQTFIAWDLTSSQGSERYFLKNNASDKNTTTLYYNLENGHIATYNVAQNRLECMYADDNGSSWNWVWWAKCDDSSPPKVNKAFWKIIPTKSNEVAFLNFQNNALRLTRFGANWGVPYIARAQYIQKDRANSPISSFAVSEDMLEWLRFIAANEGKNLFVCPAPDKHAQAEARSIQSAKSIESNQNTKPINAKNPTESTRKKSAPIDSITKDSLTKNSLAKHRLKRTPTPTTPPAPLAPPASQNAMRPTPLPPSFRFSTQWRNRFLAIIQTTDRSGSAAGICGICLLQSFQIIAEILENPTTPRQSGGYFFDTQYGVNPFVSFSLRNSLLSQSLSDVLGWFQLYVRHDVPITPELIAISGNNLAMASAISMLPQYDWDIPILGFTEEQIGFVADFVLNAPEGNVFILLMDLVSASSSGSHAVVAIRSSHGTRIIPTNVFMSEEQFADYTIPVYSREDFLERLTRGGFRITTLSAMQASAYDTLPFANVVSFSDCLGDGMGRRGSGAMPSSTQVNQCASGRCL